MQGRVEEAIELYKDSLNRDPKGYLEALTHIGLALSYIETGDLNLAETELKSAIVAFPRLTARFLKSFYLYKDDEFVDKIVNQLVMIGLPKT